MDVKLISGISCARCHTLQPILEQYCENNNLELEVIDINDADPTDIEGATQLPVIIRDGKQMDYDEVLQKISQ